MFKKKLPRKKNFFKIPSLPWSQLLAFAKFNQGDSYHKETACCFSLLHSATDTMLEPDLKQRSLSFININTWYNQNCNHRLIGSPDGTAALLKYVTVKMTKLLWMQRIQQTCEHNSSYCLIETVISYSI